MPAGRPPKYIETDDYIGVDGIDVAPRLNDSLMPFDRGECKYESMVVSKINVLCEMLGFPPVLKVYRQRLFKTVGMQIKPDILVKLTTDDFVLFECKAVNGKHPSTGPTLQAQAIGQILLYKNILPNLLHAKIFCFLISNKIYRRTMLIFQDNNINVGLVEFRQDGRVIVPRGVYGIGKDFVRL